MIAWSNLDRKVAAVRASFAPLIRAKIARYETAEIFLESSWDPLPDLPIRLYTADERIVAVSWSKFDDLWLANDESVPFLFEGSTVRWVENSIKALEPIVGASILSAALGRGEMTLGGEEVETWTRLLVEMDSGWFEVFNALDENGYAFHARRPKGDFVSCA